MLNNQMVSHLPMKNVDPLPHASLPPSAELHRHTPQQCADNAPGALSAAKAKFLAFHRFIHQNCLEAYKNYFLSFNRVKKVTHSISWLIIMESPQKNVEKWPCLNGHNPFLPPN
jgi:hypothetical protein